MIAPIAGQTLSFAGLLAGVFVLTVAGSMAYVRIASRYGPHAVPNHRSLHHRVIPKGGGIAIAVAVLAGFAVLAFGGLLDARSVAVYLGGGITMTALGAADDRLDIRPRYRLLMQVLAAGWICMWFGGLPRLDLGFAAVDLGLVGTGLLIVAFVWFYNLFNFVDGTDGMASCATIFVCVVMGAVLWASGQPDLALILALLAAAYLGFIGFNWPPARMFLGDAGTTFTSFVLSAVMLASVQRHAATLWLWLVVFAYYFADTTTTTTIRALRVPSFYRGHRSHAYQNLARVWQSHLKILLLVIAIDLLWTLPLFLVALRQPSYAALAAAVAYLPLIAFVVRYGPLYEDK